MNEYNIVTYTDDKEEIQHIVISSSDSSIQINRNLKLKNVAFLYNLIVNHQQQNKGLGRAIINYAINYCKNSLFCDTITLNCLTDSWMIEWYKRMNFREVDTVERGQYIFMVLFV